MTASVRGPLTSMFGVRVYIEKARTPSIERPTSNFEVEPMPPDSRSDLELVEALNAGDASAFDALYYRHRDWVVRLARRFSGHGDDALDVLQETFACLAGKFPGFRL